MLNIYEEIKIILLRKGLAPFRRKRVRFEMVQEILDFLGYEIVIREKQK